jgi:glycosyltransferase involved in cell wall biosynthesis
MLRASVIVPARDSEATLARTLEALACQELEGGFEVIVVDDGSSDRTAQIAREAPGQVTLLEQSALGPAAARNLGVASAHAGLLAFCDADVFPAAGWLKAGVEALEHHDLVQGQVLPDPLAQMGPFDRTIWVTRDSGLWETANLFVTRETFEATGGFEEWLRPEIGKALAEDVWFGWRSRRLGARTAYCPAALAHHAVFERDWREYAAERRRLRYFPAMAAKMPELREGFLHRRLFLSGRSARFDLALAGVVAAAARRSPWPLAASVPYLRALWRHSHRAWPVGPGWRRVAAADLAADVIGLESMVRGSLRYRSPVL